MDSPTRCWWRWMWHSRSPECLCTRRTLARHLRPRWCSSCPQSSTRPNTARAARTLCMLWRWPWRCMCRQDMCSTGPRLPLGRRPRPIRPRRLPRMMVLGSAHRCLLSRSRHPLHFLYHLFRLWLVSVLVLTDYHLCSPGHHFRRPAVQSTRSSRRHSRIFLPHL